MFVGSDCGSHGRGLVVDESSVQFSSRGYGHGTAQAASGQVFIQRRIVRGQGGLTLSVREVYAVTSAVRK